MEQVDIPLFVQKLSKATSAKIGQDYFDSLVAFLGEALGKQYVFIGELVNNATAIRTKSVFAQGRLAENLTYDLVDTPCENVLGKNTCVYRHGVQNLFPKDFLLQQMGVDSYIGAPLFTSSGLPFGLIVILDTKPIVDDSFIQVCLELVVARISAEYERHSIVERLAEQEKRFRDLVDCSSDFIWEVNENLEYTFSTSTLDGILGYAPEDMLGKTPFDFMPQAERERVRNVFEPLWKNREPFSELENINFHKDGSQVYIETSAVPIFDSDNRFKGYRGLDRDITERKKKEIDLRLAATVLDTASEAVMVTDINNLIIKVNAAFTRITGYSQDEAMGRTPSLLKSGHHGADFYEEMRHSLQQNSKWEGEIWNRKKNGEVFPEWLTISLMTGRQGDPEGYVCLFSDISKRKKDEKKIQYQANYDALTGLANRHLLFERFSDALNLAERQSQNVSLFFIDLDRFKQVNDSLGHSFGDQLIKDAATRLQNCIRKTDTAARLGGDEFAIICSGISDISQTEAVLSHILTVLSEPYWIKGQKIVLSASIGVTVFPDDGLSIEDLLRNADSAMYRAKENGRNTYQFFTEEMHLESVQRLQMGNALRKAVENEEFVLNYQPIINSSTNTVVGCEALIRWHSPELGLVNPDDFIALAEEMGMISPIGQWVLEEACSQMSLLAKELPADFFVSVNVSSYQFQNENMCLVVNDVLEKTELSPSMLALEITESLMMNVDSSIISQLDELKNMGVSISIDDFGTGYSSLSYLHKFPISTLKIDRSFIQDIVTNESRAPLVDAIISMSQSLGLKVIAEGIEEEAQAELLLQKKCDLFQGYLFGKPMDINEFCRLLNLRVKMELGR